MTENLSTLQTTPYVPDTDARWENRKDEILQPKRDALDSARKIGAPQDVVDRLARDLRGWAIMLEI